MALPDNVDLFPGDSELDYDPDIILECARGELKKVVVVGFDHEGSLYVKSSNLKYTESIALLAMAQHAILRDTLGARSEN